MEPLPVQATVHHRHLAGASTPDREKVATEVTTIQAGSMIDELAPVTYEFIGRL
jgi:hypothetical protein